MENQPSGTAVLQVEATDADEGANGMVKYGLMHRGGVLPAFSIHPDTGKVNITADTGDHFVTLVEKQLNTIRLHTFSFSFFLIDRI